MSFARCLLAAVVYGRALPSVIAERKRKRSVWRRKRKQEKNQWAQ